MPLHGLVHDSSFLYYASKAARSGGGRKYGRPPINFKITVTKLVIYKPVLNFELNNRYGMVGQHLHKIANRINMGAKAQVGYKSGHLRRSIHIEHVDGARGQSVKIGSDVSYALLHHEGTRPHIIAPSPPNTVLRFRAGAKIIHSPIVRHPGTKPNRYLSDQLRIHVR